MMLYLKIYTMTAINNFRATQNNSDFQFFLINETQLKPDLHIVARIEEHVCDDASKNFKALNISIANMFGERSILTIITTI